MGKYKWESESLRWIHEIREKQYREARKSGKSYSEWLRSHPPVDVEALVKKLGLKNVKIVQPPKKQEAG